MNESHNVRAVAELVQCVSLFGQAWLEDVIRVSYDAVKESHRRRSRTGQRRLGRHCCSIRAVLHDEAASRGVHGWQLSTCLTMLELHTGSVRRLWREICHAVMWSACRACVCNTLMAYSSLEFDDSNVVTWSAAVSLSFTMTPRIRRLDTRSMSRYDGGGARIRPAVKMISFVLSLLSFKLLSTAHACRCWISSWHVFILTAGTMR